MDLFEFFFKQIVTQSQLDWVFEQAQQADHSIALDNDITGIVNGLDCQQHAPVPDKNIDIVGPGQAYDKDGQRIGVNDLLTVLDCSQDEYGTNSNPPTPLFERYISVFVRFNRDLTEPMLDGNNITVYTKQLESYEFFVRLGAEAAAGLSVPAPLMDDAILQCDILVVNGFVSILNADFDLTRREDWTRFLGAVIGSRVYGTSQEAVTDILALIETWGTAIPFAFTDTWFGAAAVAGSAPPPLTIQTALDAIVYDLAQAGAVTAGTPLIGALDSGAFPGGFVTPWVGTDLDLVLISLGTDLDAHIGGAPPAHPAAAIVFTPYLWLASIDVQAALQEVVDDLANVGAGTSGVVRIGAQPIAGTPEAWAGGTLSALLIAIYGHLNDRTERATDETISADWEFTGLTEMTGPYQTIKSKFGGALPPDGLVSDICTRQTWGTRKNWSQMWQAANSHTCAAAPQDLCCAIDGSDVYVLAMVPGNVTVEIIDTRDITVTDVADITTAGAPAPTAICCDGPTVYVMFNNDTVSAWTFDPTPGGGAWTPRWGPIALPGGASGSFDRIAVVTDAYVMTANSGLNSNVGNCFTRIQRADGLGVLSGLGSMVVNVNNFPRGGLASCGTTVYATTLDSATPANAELIEINPATMGSPGHFGPPGSNPAGGAATNDWRDIVCDGSLIWIVEAKVTPGLVQVYPVETAVANYQANEFAWPANHYGRYLVFDGFNVWCTRHTTALGTPNGVDLQGIQVCDASWVGGGKAPIGMIARQTQPWVDLAPSPGKLTFDGDAVWAIHGPDGGAPVDTICRLPHAPDRC